MKKIMKKEKILLAISVLLIAIGTIIAATVGFKFDLAYDKTQKIELVIGKEFDSQDIKKIVKESTNGRENMIQKVEVYEDSLGIIAKNINEEQKKQIVEKINEKYQLEIKAEEVKIEQIPHNRGRDIVKPYIAPMLISTIIVMIYIAIRYRKIGTINTLLKTIFLIALMQIDLFGLIAITRIPVGRLTIPMAIMVYLLTLIFCTTKFEKELNKKMIEIEKEKND